MAQLYMDIGPPVANSTISGDSVDIWVSGGPLPKPDMGWELTVVGLFSSGESELDGFEITYTDALPVQESTGTLAPTKVGEWDTIQVQDGIHSIKLKIHRHRIPPWGPYDDDQWSQATSVTVHNHKGRVVGIKFVDWAGGNEYDLKWNAAPDSLIEDPVWTATVSADGTITETKDSPVAYNRNTPMRIEADLGAGGVGVLTPVDVTVTPTAGGYTFSPSSRTITVTDWGAEDYADLQFGTSALPDMVGVFWTNITWEVEYNNNSQTQSNEHEVFVTLDLPSYPMGVPWVPVIRHACWWAGAQSTVEGALGAITAGVYGLPAFDWETATIYGMYQFNLTQYLIHSENFWHKTEYGGNCTDVTNLLVVLCNSIGGNVRRRMINQSGGSDKFWTKSIDPIGDPGWQTKHWTYHHKIERTLSPWNEWDACLKYGTAPTGELPTNVPDGEYRDKLWDQDPNLDPPNTFTYAEDADLPNVE